MAHHNYIVCLFGETLIVHGYEKSSYFGGVGIIHFLQYIVDPVELRFSECQAQGI